MFSFKSISLLFTQFRVSPLTIWLHQQQFASIVIILYTSSAFTNYCLVDLYNTDPWTRIVLFTHNVSTQDWLNSFSNTCLSSRTTEWNRFQSNESSSHMTDWILTESHVLSSDTTDWVRTESYVSSSHTTDWVLTESHVSSSHTTDWVWTESYVSSSHTTDWVLTESYVSSSHTTDWIPTEFNVSSSHTTNWFLTESQVSSSHTTDWILTESPLPVCLAFYNTRVKSLMNALVWESFGEIPVNVNKLYIVYFCLPLSL